MQERILQLKNSALGAILQARSNEELMEVKDRFLGKQGAFTLLFKEIKNVPAEERGHIGNLLNELKLALEEALDTTAATFEVNSRPTKQKIDVTLPGHRPTVGHFHPTTLVVDEMNAIFGHLGFSVYSGPEIETDEYNYNRVNLPIDHPARDLQDSLYIQEPNYLLRTHTSSVEARILQKVKEGTISIPFRFVIPGKVYRYENANATNNIMFYQYEGMAIGENITMADLKGTLDLFVKNFFGKDRETRFRCKYYPQVEPGVGVDISCLFCKKKGCTVCKGRGWIEMLGAGMVHPNMFRIVGLDPQKYSGFAWGMGLDRIVMQRYGIQDIRSLYNGDIGYKE